jgi:hypothetical protein
VFAYRGRRGDDERSSAEDDLVHSPQGQPGTPHGFGHHQGCQII